MYQRHEPGPIEEDVAIVSETRLISPIVGHVMKAIEAAGCAHGQKVDIEHALREAVTNAVIHGNRLDSRKRVYVRCRCEPASGVTLEVSDEGRGFDLSLISEPFKAAGTVSDHGTGILTMRALMDEVRFENRGSRVRMWKSLSG